MALPFSWGPAGDRAALVRWRGEAGPEASAAVRAFIDGLERQGIAGVGETVPGYVTVLVYYDPLLLPSEGLERALAAAARYAVVHEAPAGRSLTVPVLYGGETGPDLERVAAGCGMTPAEVVAAHAGQEYTVHFLGFAPGFAYMGRLPAALRAPRLAQPRTSVPAGAVGIAGEQTGIYPGGTPGGWQIIGRTPVTVYDPRREPSSFFRPGDRVRFRPVSQAEYDSVAGQVGGPVRAGVGPALADGEPTFLVRRPGPLTTVQDLGRPGHQKEGVPPGGAADPFSLRIANRLVGNPPGAAALEVTLMGLELEALGHGAAAVAGADLGARLNGRPVPPGWSFAFSPGDRLGFAGGVAGCRAYLAVAGGFTVPPLLGSRSTDLLGRFGGFGGRPLRAGDVLAAGEPAVPPAEAAGRRVRPGVLPAYGPEVVARALPGPQEDWFPREALAVFFGEPFAVTPASDRMGLRLAGPPVPSVPPEPGQELLSEGIPLGAVQVPGDGQPIVLLAGRQTVGGYPKPAVVISPDTCILAQARPGYTTVRFQAVTLAEAHAALSDWMRRLDDPELIA